MVQGFEIKRRGELQLIKRFQGEVFERFLHGDSLQTCFDAVGAVANHWLAVLETRGRDLEDAELFDLISETKNLRERVVDYGDRKSTSLTTARRLGEFLGAEMTRDPGLNCQFIISSLPESASVSERAVPVAIFSAEDAVKKHFLRR